MAGCCRHPPHGLRHTEARSGAQIDSGTSTDGGGNNTDGGDVDGGYPFDLPAIDYTVNPGEPIVAPAETWTFAPVADAHCANGTSTGMAVNLTDRSRRVLIFLAGEGACWEAAACAAGTATHTRPTSPRCSPGRPRC
ncbi:MAG: hypothetical protein IRZ16_19615 [Myxococcaceae bacterium]|nr:hypothetical protein [Myxococcaceae bacterium]